MELNETQLYDLVGDYHLDTQSKEIANLILKQMAIHLYVEHELSSRIIAKRLNLKVKQVDQIVSDYYLK